MKSAIKKSLQGLLLVPALALGVGAVVPMVQSSDAQAQCAVTSGVRNGIDCAKGNSQSTSIFGSGSFFEKIVNTLLFLIGAISVIMIIYGGFKYVTSGGDSSGVTSAKNTILYAVVGLIVALLAYAILSFVLTNIGGDGTATVSTSGGEGR